MADHLATEGEQHRMTGAEYEAGLERMVADAKARDRARLPQACKEYAELMYPDDETRDQLTEDEARRREHTARSRAVEIADLAITLGLHHTDVDDDADGM